MVIIDEARLKWPRTSVLDVYSHNTGHNLWRAGYKTLGDVLATSEEDLARDVLNVGPVRAKSIRRKAYAAAQRTMPKQHKALAARPAPEQDAEPEHAPPGVTGPLLALAAVGCFGTLLFLSIS